jgi:hypothetical protein
LRSVNIKLEHIEQSVLGHQVHVSHTEHGGECFITALLHHLALGICATGPAITSIVFALVTDTIGREKLKKQRGHVYISRVESYFFRDLSCNRRLNICDDRTHSPKDSKEGENNQESNVERCYRMNDGMWH